LRFLPDEDGAFRRAKTAAINLKVIFFAAMNPVVLPAGQADQPVTALPLAGLQNFQRCKHTNEKDSEAREQCGIFFLLVFQHDIINDQIVALSGNGMAHAAQDLGADRPGLDDNQWLSIFGNFLESKAIRMILQGVRQHGAEVIHLYVQERRAGNFLELSCKGALA